MESGSSLPEAITASVKAGNIHAASNAGVIWLWLTLSSLFLIYEHQKGEVIMKIAVTYENGEVFQHFGHTEQFKLYTVENGAVTGSEVVSTNGSGHGRACRLPCGA